jgi:putative membrane-bound dehydrogenase-like protein
MLGLIPWHAHGAFPAPYNSEPDTSSPALPAAEAAARFKAPPGFQVSAFAAEPDIQNPIAMNWDARGRLWVVENYTYAERAKKLDLSLLDRVLIFEDAKGDGRFSSRRIFTDTVQVATSVEPGADGVWLMCPPQLLFIPDKNADDMPDAPPQVILDGFTVPEQNYHGFANGLRIGPDGWLYGRCGASAPGEIGRPGTPAPDRVPLRGTMWRYHPQRRIFEALSAGTTNPWGHDWDAHGELFFINTVNGHLWHGITGAHFVRSHTLDPNPHVYHLIGQHADHWHFDTAGSWTKSRDGAANDFGGGHAHIGMMIYQGDHWPDPYRGNLFTWNLHGRRLNQEILERTGSGYVGKHGPDLLLAEDPWFRGMELSTGPDGGVFALDWSDTGECHDHTGVHRTSGRIFKITHGTPGKPAAPDLTKLTAPELVKLHLHPNAWWARQARLELVRRAASGKEIEGAPAALRTLFAQHPDTVTQLRALWTLHGIGAADEAFLTTQLHHPDEHVRTWAIRLLTDLWPLDTVMSLRPADRPEPAPGAALVAEFNRLAREDPSGLVRLALASTLQRLPVGLRPGLAAALTARAGDAADHNLPLMVWYGLIPVALKDPVALVEVARTCEWSLTTQCLARRLAEDLGKNPGPLNALLEVAANRPEAFQSDILTGISAGLTGWRKAAPPAAWNALAKGLAGSPDAQLRERVRELSVLFGDGRALDAVKQVALDGKADPAARQAALRTLIENRPPDLQAVCGQLLGVRHLSASAVRGLALFEDPAIAEKLATTYPSFSPADRPVVIETLVSRPAFARILLRETAAGRIPRADLTPFHARQIRSFNDDALTRQLKESWGGIRDTSADKQALIARLKPSLTPDRLRAADPGKGRVLFTNLCGACHTLYGEGGTLGPDLTGSGRGNLDYLLDNIVDPGAVVGADFRMTVASLKDGRVLNGFIAAQTERTLTLKSMTGSLTLDRAEIVRLEESPDSIMPEGLLGTLGETQVRDLIAYLMSGSQVPLPEDPK